MEWNDIISNELNKKHIGDIKAKEVVFLCALGRLVKNKLPYSFNIIALSCSSAGKDHLVSSVLKIFPRKDYETFGRISKTSLNYLHTLDKEPDYNYNGKIIYLKEISSDALNNEIMKEFTSSEEEISRVAITRQKGAGVDIKEIRGHPCVFCTTATTIPNPEIMNRFSIVKLDESEEQTKAIRRAYWKSEYSDKIMEEISYLEEKEVEIPKELYDYVDKHFPTNKPRHRRDFPKFLDWVKAIAIFHQRDRLEQVKGTIIAQWEDYNIARDIFLNSYSGVADVVLKPLDKNIIEVLNRGNDPKSAKEIITELDIRITPPTIYYHLENLINTNIVEKFELRDVFNNPTTKYGLSLEYKNKEPIILPIYEG